MRDVGNGNRRRKVGGNREESLRPYGAKLVSPGTEVKSIGDFGESLVDFCQSLVDFSQSLVDFEKLSGRPGTSLGGAGDCSLGSGSFFPGRK